MSLIAGSSAADGPRSLRQMPDQHRHQVIWDRHQPLEVSPGSLQKSEEPLQAPRTPDSNDRPHERREVPRGDHHQVPLRDARESS